MAANREFRPMDGVLDTGEVLLSGHIGLNATGGVAASTTHFNAGSCTRTGTGAYTITLADQYYMIVSSHLQLVPGGAGKDLYVEPGAISGINGTAAGKTILFTTRSISARAAADADAAATVQVLITAKRSGLKW